MPLDMRGGGTQMLPPHWLLFVDFLSGCLLDDMMHNNNGPQLLETILCLWLWWHNAAYSPSCSRLCHAKTFWCKRCWHLTPHSIYLWWCCHSGCKGKWCPSTRNIMHVDNVMPTPHWCNCHTHRFFLFLLHCYPIFPQVTTTPYLDTVVTPEVTVHCCCLCSIAIVVPLLLSILIIGHCYCFTIIHFVALSFVIIALPFVNVALLFIHSAVNHCHHAVVLSSISCGWLMVHCSCHNWLSPSQSSLVISLWIVQYFYEVMAFLF